MPIIYAWTLGEVNTRTQPVEFFTSPATRFQGDSIEGYNQAAKEAKKHRKEAANQSLALTLFKLEVSQHVLDSVGGLRLQTGLMNPDGVSQTSDVIRLQLRYHQFSESGHVSYNLDDEIVSESGSLKDKPDNISEPPKFPTTQARITEADVPWYLKAARWIGQHIWGFGWLADWAQPKINDITREHQSFELEYVVPPANASIGGQTSTSEPVNSPALFVNTVTDTVSDKQPLRSPSFSNSSGSNSN
ncbi:hypothetical protein Lgee_2080 [Legionella geestiana]|uniref:Uncharacterized protein n=1 Tax=Legionella geestiana TaxID=45065 RepID=A0A0W0TPE1_9GAMM|nr:hypothetical protein [Legionella geestiana]KTC97109.1 hypothetical protein Lgee_2080 [Legionella geestiana]QBS11464.1 hypothetical protein E4T54_01190 [Legionella geestiana]STX53873.1 Uncharacterised protein [Legionella geestiana]